MLVIDLKEPGRKEWEMSPEGFAELDRKHPGRYQAKQSPVIVVVEKKSIVVEKPQILEVVPPVKKGKRGKSKA